MRTEENISQCSVHGEISVWRILHQKRRPIRLQLHTEQPNQLQLSWGAIACRTIGLGDTRYRVRAMYIEYENTNQPIVVPTCERDSGADYYQDLVNSGTRDFLRVPLLLSPGISRSNHFDGVILDAQEGNRLTFAAQTQGNTGFHGKPFSAAASSTAFGVALVATPQFDDPSKDIVFSRTYLPPEKHVVKQASEQLGIMWEILFT